MQKSIDFAKEQGKKLIFDPSRCTYILQENNFLINKLKIFSMAPWKTWFSYRGAYLGKDSCFSKRNLEVCIIGRTLCYF